VTLRAIYFYVSELRFRKSTPYFLATFSCLWLSNLIPGIIVIVPAILFLGFRAAVWSAMSYAAFEIYGMPKGKQSAQLYSDRAIFLGDLCGVCCGLHRADPAGQLSAFRRAI